DWPTVQKLIDDPRALELSRKVRVEGVATWGLHDGDVAITLTDGRVLRADAADIPAALLHPTWEEAVAKLERLSGCLADERREAIVAAVAGLDEADGLEDLTAALRAAIPTDDAAPASERSAP
ncbi:MAG TPA: hypothetical protein VHZ54_05710, partial [Solirubrobacterales bacterium]|nr:hypothetical protein [Solirubrobacterales bacterium]